jgi:hypothetical protein
VTFDLGDTVPLSTQIRDAAGALTVATGVVCTVGLPDGTTTTPAPANPSTGLYTVDFVPTQVGRHTERWTSTSPATARSDIFDVRPPTPGYIVSLADAKAHLNMSATRTADDEELRGWIETSTELVEEIAGITVVRRTVVEVRRFPHGARRFALHHTPAVSLTSLVDLNGFLTWSPTDFNLDGETGIVDVLWSGGSRPLYGLVQITYVVGLAAIPARFTSAAKMILRHLWESQRAAVGGNRRTQFGGAAEEVVKVAGYAVPRAAAELIGSALSGIA